MQFVIYWNTLSTLAVKHQVPLQMIEYEKNLADTWGLYSYSFLCQLSANWIFLLLLFFLQLYIVPMKCVYSHFKRSHSLFPDVALD